MIPFRKARKVVRLLMAGLTRRALLRAATAGLAALGAAAAGAQLQEWPGALEPPDLLELRGHVGPPLPDETGGWDLTLGVGFSPTVYDFHLADMRVLNSGRLALSILSALEPYRPTLFLFGTTEQMQVLAGATPRQPLLITGWRRRGSRTMMLTGLAPAPTATPAATPAGAPTP